MFHVKHRRVLFHVKHWDTIPANLKTFHVKHKEISIMGIGQPAFTAASAAARGVAPPTNLGSGNQTSTEPSTTSGSHPMTAKGAAITVAALAGLLVVGNIAQQRDALPVGEGLLKIRPFNVVAIGVSATLFLVGAKYLANKFPVPGMTDIINAA